MSTAKVWVRMPSMKNYDGQPLAVGEVFNLRNGLLDDKLLENRYVIKVEKSQTSDIVSCIKCSREFISQSYLNAHSMSEPSDPIEVDSIQLKSPDKGLDVMASGSDRELEPQGAPAPEPVGAGATAHPDGQRRNSGRGSKAHEVIRLEG